MTFDCSIAARCDFWSSFSMLEKIELIDPPKTLNGYVNALEQGTLRCFIPQNPELQRPAEERNIKLNTHDRLYRGNLSLWLHFFYDNVNFAHFDEPTFLKFSYNPVTRESAFLDNKKVEYQFRGQQLATRFFELAVLILMADQVPFVGGSIRKGNVPSLMARTNARNLLTGEPLFTDVRETNTDFLITTYIPPMRA